MSAHCLDAFSDVAIGQSESLDKIASEKKRVRHNAGVPQKAESSMTDARLCEPADSGGPSLLGRVTGS